MGCCVLLSVPFLVDARDSELIRRMQAVIEKKATEEWAGYIDKVHSALKYQAGRQENFYVRAKLLALAERVEEEYASSSLTWNVQTDNRKNKKTFLTKAGTTIGKPATTKTSTKKSKAATRRPLLEPVAKEIEEVQTPTIEAPQKKPVDSVPSLYVLENGHIDIAKVQNTWLERVNELRTSRNLSPYSIEPLLHKTASDRSNTMKEKGKADHKRFDSSGYYEYGQLEQRFAKRWATFKNINRSTFTENVGYAYISCNDADCTDEVIIGMRTVFDYFRSEEGKPKDEHRRSLMHPLFSVVWVGIAVDEDKGVIYTSMHYATALTEEE